MKMKTISKFLQTVYKFYWTLKLDMDLKMRLNGKMVKIQKESLLHPFLLFVLKI